MTYVPRVALCLGLIRCASTPYLERPQGILSRLIHDRTPGVRGEAVKALAFVAAVADASAGRWLLLLGEVRKAIFVVLAELVYRSREIPLTGSCSGPSFFLVERLLSLFLLPLLLLLLLIVLLRPRFLCSFSRRNLSC